MKKTTLFFTLFGICGFFVVGGIYLLRPNTWNCFIYQKVDGGLHHESVGEFRELKDCKEAGEKALSNGKTLPIPLCQGDQCKADAYMCGKGCITNAFVGDVFLSEYECHDKFDSAK